MKNSIYKYLPLIGSIVASAIFCLLFAFNVNPFFSNNGGDSAIFQQLGLAILKGKAIYVDIFDHKGFILFLIQALGQLIAPGHLGLFLLMVINIALTFLLWYKTARIYLDSLTSVLPVLFAAMVYALTIDKGNFSECWSLPYISLAIYFFTKYLYGGKLISYGKCFYVGCCIGIVAFIRLNNIAAICAVCLLLTILYLKKGEYLRLLYSALVVLTGVIFITIITSGIYVILSGWENLYELYYGTFIFNFKYISNYGNGSILCVPFYIALAILLVELVCTLRDKDKSLFVFAISCFIITFVSMGKAYFGHYFIISSPIFVISLTDIFRSQLYKSIKHKRRIFITIAIMAIIISIIAFPYIRPRFERGFAYERAIPALKKETDKIPASERDSIWNYSGCINVFQSCGILQCNKLVLVSHRNRDEHLFEPVPLSDYRPCWIAMKEGFEWTESTKADSLFISDNYILKIKTEGFYTGFDKEVLFYRRKDLELGRK